MSAPSQGLLKLIASLKMPKYRQKYGQFTVEGRKSIEELIHSGWEVDTILATSSFIDRYKPDYPYNIISEQELKKISQYDTPPGALALAKCRNYTLNEIDWNVPVVLALDNISDPGNLGTIIRTADWYGINQILLTPNCTDFYNHKSLAATMGSFTRCKFVYTPLEDLLLEHFAIGCFLEGEDIHQFVPPPSSIVIIGSESHGISQSVGSKVSAKVTIPRIGHAESLNAGIAAAIVLDNIIRKTV